MTQPRKPESKAYRLIENHLDPGFLQMNDVKKTKEDGMEIRFLKRNMFQRIFGIPATPRYHKPDFWKYADGKLTLDLEKVTELKNPGTAIRLEGENLPVRLLVVLGGDKRYHVFQNRCTHAGHRRLDFVPGTNTVQCCSVSKSTYDFSGKKIYGPAPKPITAYPVTVQENQLIVSLA